MSILINMNFAALTFRIAGIWGLLVLLPMYFLFDAIGRANPPAMNHPQFYYGFLGVTLVWQVLFLVMSRDPIRYRPLFPVAMAEKLIFIVTMLALWMSRQVRLIDTSVALPDCILTLLFVTAWVQTAPGRTNR